MWHNVFVCKTPCGHQCAGISSPEQQRSYSRCAVTVANCLHNDPYPTIGLSNVAHPASLSRSEGSITAVQLVALRAIVT